MASLKSRKHPEKRLLSQQGREYPVAQGSTEKSKSVRCKSNPSGMSAWHLLENGVRVCVLYKGNKPFAWIPASKEREIVNAIDEMECKFCGAVGDDHKEGCINETK